MCRSAVRREYTNVVYKLHLSSSILQTSGFLLLGGTQQIDFVPILGHRPGSVTFNIPTDAYSIEKIDYHADGDILNLWRKGLDDPLSVNPTVVYQDKLNYQYTDISETHLASINETGSEEGGVRDATYTYDLNGNLTSDSGKGITRIDYNHLNLPIYIEFSSPSNHIKIYYDANGKKLKKETKTKIAPLVTQHYIDGIEYTQIGTALLELEAIYHSEGRVVPDATQPLGWRYEFTLRDHLGNSRVMFSDKNGDGIIQAFGEQVPGPVAPDYTEILQEEHYYPFGGTIDGAWSVNNAENPNKYQYNGKEFNGDLGLNWLDYGARWYDPGIARWNVVDPLAGEFASWSPYSYVFNNPLIFIDPDGRAPETVKPTSAAALQMIKNTLRPEDAAYVTLDSDGNINRDVLNLRSMSSSGNFNSLKEMVNSDIVLEVSLDDSFNYIDGQGNPGAEEMPYLPTDEYSDFDLDGSTMGGTTTGESGSMGKTLFPDRNGLQNSPDNTVKVIVNENLSEPARAEMYSHEANGHAHIYMMNGGAIVEMIKDILEDILEKVKNIKSKESPLFLDRTVFFREIGNGFIWSGYVEIAKNIGCKINLPLPKVFDLFSEK